MTAEEITKCDVIYDAIISLDSSDNYVLFKMASCFLNGYNLDKLRAMITSSDNCQVTDALFILGEIGDMTRLFKEELLAVVQGDDEELAADARKLFELY